jgi:hypothetical protein
MQLGRADWRGGVEKLYNFDGCFQMTTISVAIPRRHVNLLDFEPWQRFILAGSWHLFWLDFPSP